MPVSAMRAASNRLLQFVIFNIAGAIFLCARRLAISFVAHSMTLADWLARVPKKPRYSDDNKPAPVDGETGSPLSEKPAEGAPAGRQDSAATVVNSGASSAPTKKATEQT
jgi:hypothetical protein